MKERSIAFLAGLWRFLAAIWTLVIVSALAGALGNLHNFTSWISANLVWIIIVFLAVLALTICAYIAHIHQVREDQKQQQVKDQQLINAVKELKAPVSHLHIHLLARLRPQKRYQTRCDVP